MEIWKDIKKYADYQASNLGNIRSVKFNKIKELKTSLNSDGYPQVVLCINGKRISRKVHVLVAMAFLDHIPNGRTLVVHHKDSNRLNAKLENLQIVTHRKNNSIERTEKSGLPTGVYTKRNKFGSRIFVNGKIKHLGHFESIEEAVNAYNNELTKL